MDKQELYDLNGSMLNRCHIIQYCLDNAPEEITSLLITLLEDNFTNAQQIIFEHCYLDDT